MPVLSSDLFQISLQYNFPVMQYRNIITNTPTSDRICVENRTVVVSFTSSRMSRISFRPSGSKAEVGSSQISSLG